MTRIWEFYENLNEIVYAADIETYELEYMNKKACETYGLTSFAEVKGKKCYEVLQNKSAPCDFCTNQCLKEGYFHEWQIFNPRLGTTFALKDTIVWENGKSYRVELAIDMTIQEAQKRIIQEYNTNERMINEGLRIALAEPTPERSTEVLLAYLGKHLKSERVYIFEENAEGMLDNTFEWCGEGVTPQKESLQNVPFEVVVPWYEAFSKNENVIIKDIEVTREEDPLLYEYLAPQNIHSLVVSPIINQNKVIGFYGVDNPPKELLEHISTLFWIVGHFILSLLKRRALVKSLKHLSMNDQLTQIGNRHAMHEYQKTFGENESIGILYCDVMGLKQVNDSKGHQEGDALLLRACDCLKRQFDKEELFRVGGDEFLVLCKGIQEQELMTRIGKLQVDMETNAAVMALGYIWEPKGTRDFDKMLAEADAKMYDNKRKHYEQMGVQR